MPVKNHRKWYNLSGYDFKVFASACWWMLFFAQRARLEKGDKGVYRTKSSRRKGGKGEYRTKSSKRKEVKENTSGRWLINFKFITESLT